MAYDQQEITAADIACAVNEAGYEAAGLEGGMNTAEISKGKAEPSIKSSESVITIDGQHHAASVAVVALGSPVLRKVTIPAQGMTCAACQSRVQRVLQAEAGVVDASVHLMLKQAVITYDSVVTELFVLAIQQG